MNTQTLSIGSFLRAFGGHWFTLMSGSLSVPFTVASVFVENNWRLRSLFVVLAVLCVVVASYKVWQDERTARNVAEERLKPKLKFVIGDCCSESPHFGRVGVANLSAASVEDASVYITIPPFLDSQLVKWASETGPTGPSARNLDPGTHAHTDFFLFVLDDGDFRIWDPQVPRLRVSPGAYTAELSVRGRNAVQTTARIRFTFELPKSLTVRLVMPD